MQTKNIEALFKFFETTKTINPYDAQYELKRLLECKEALLSYAKFKINDKVVLIETPVIDEKTNYGWLGCKDILVKNALAIVEDVDYYNSSFRYSIIFEKAPETIFSFLEKDLQRYSVEVCAICKDSHVHVHSDLKTYVQCGFANNAEANRMFSKISKEVAISSTNNILKTKRNDIITVEKYYGPGSGLD